MVLSVCIGMQGRESSVQKVGKKDLWEEGGGHCRVWQEGEGVIEIVQARGGSHKRK